MRAKVKRKLNLLAKRDVPLKEQREIDIKGSKNAKKTKIYGQITVRPLLTINHAP
ncbi:hypothetical protein WN55_06733 [Dufourea novaeangliae]|uniref:Uncharacterized protein n=1 Tax=Dufourea novaeangliae TaxID=178035 RepID=A0A154P0Q9_DUFNO|nr:hypothetical protein WN55_06733 [Dufourea novaeangliae]